MQSQQRARRLERTKDREQSGRRDQVNPPLAAGEIVTTGTLTRALPVSAGETWTTQLTGVGLDGICVRFA